MSPLPLGEAGRGCEVRLLSLWERLGEGAKLTSLFLITARFTGRKKMHGALARP